MIAGDEQTLLSLGSYGWRVYLVFLNGTPSLYQRKYEHSNCTCVLHIHLRPVEN